METRIHVLCMSRVSLAPGFVVEVIYLSRAVVALVEGGCYETLFGGGGGWLGVVGVQDLGCEGGHCFFGLETRVEEPEAGDGGDVG